MERWEYWRPIDEKKFLAVYAIYHGLPEHPDKYVIQRWRIQGDKQKPEKPPFTADSLEEARKFIPPNKMQLEPCLIDPRHVVEVWM